MKKILLLCVLICCAFTLHAYETWTDLETGIEWKYVVISNDPKEVELYGRHDGYGASTPCILSEISGHLIIPEVINGYAVVGIQNGAFANTPALTALTLSKGIRYINGGGNFINYSADYYTSTFGNSGITKLIIPNPITIGIGVLGNSGINELVIPKDMEISLHSWYKYSSLSDPEKAVNARTVRIWTKGAPFSIPTSFSVDKLYYSVEYAEDWMAHISSLPTANAPRKSGIWGGRVEIFPSFSQFGNFICSAEVADFGDEVSVTATPNEGFEFLGWSSDVEGICGTGETITFTMPERDVTLVPNFFPTTLVEGLVTASINAQIEAGALVRPADVDAKITTHKTETPHLSSEDVDAKITAHATSKPHLTEELVNGKVAAVETKVTAVEAALTNHTNNAPHLSSEDVDAKVDAKVQEQIEPIKKAGVQEALDADEVYTKDEMQVLAYDDPLIEVVDGKARVGIALQKATSLTGDWKTVTVTEPSTTDDGKVIVDVKPEEGETTAFYRFVVGDEDKKESEESTEQ